ncbi:MAG: hypothetical protein DWQ02_06230, partial [Bacteroidetes bacterium]
MNFDEIIAVSGLPGLYRMVANRSNGLIVEELSSGKRRFASARKHQFTPLASIGIYTDDGDTVELKKVFRNMDDQFEDNPPVDVNVSGEDLREYFSDVLPNYDQDRVKTADIKKVIKWYVFLKEGNMLSLEDNQDDTNNNT